MGHNWFCHLNQVFASRGHSGSTLLIAAHLLKTQKRSSRAKVDCNIFKENRWIHLRVLVRVFSRILVCILRCAVENGQVKVRFCWSTDDNCLFCLLVLRGHSVFSENQPINTVIKESEKVLICQSEFEQRGKLIVSWTSQTAPFQDTLHSAHEVPVPGIQNGAAEESVCAIRTQCRWRGNSRWASGYCTGQDSIRPCWSTLDQVISCLGVDIWFYGISTLQGSLVFSDSVGSEFLSHTSLTSIDGTNFKIIAGSSICDLPDDVLVSWIKSLHRDYIGTNSESILSIVHDTSVVVCDIVSCTFIGWDLFELWIINCKNIL